MRLTKRGEFLVAYGFLLLFLLAMAIAGRIQYG